MGKPDDDQARWSEQYLGNVKYSPPPWWKNFRKKSLPALKTQANRIGPWLESNRRNVGTALGLICLILLGSHVVLRWYQSLPRPTQLSVTIIAPGPTPLKDDAVPEPVVFRFSASAAKLEAVNKPVDKNIRMKPVHRGSWTWTSDRELTFRTDQEWTPGREYRVELPKDLFAEHVYPEAYAHTFHAAGFTMTVKKAEFYQDPRDPDLKKIVATIGFSHPVDPLSLKQRVFLDVEGESTGGILGFGEKSYPFSITYDEKRGEAYIHSERIKIKEKEDKMRILIHKGVRASLGGVPFEQEVRREVGIPGIYTIFRVAGNNLLVVRNAEYVPEQVLMLDFTTGVLDTEVRKNLDVYLLPRDKPALQGQPRRMNYYWRNVAEIGPEVLTEAKPLDLTALPTDREYALAHSFRYGAEPGRHLYVRIKKGAAAFGGYKLAETYDAILRVPEFPKEVQIMHEGSLLSMTGDKTVRILARGVPSVRFELARVRPGQINHLVSQSQGRFDNPNFYWRFGADNISERFEEVRVFPDPDPTSTLYASLDLDRFLAKSARPQGLFFLKAQAWDHINKRPLGPEDNRMILITDMGLYVKEELGGSRAVFVQSLRTGAPVHGAEVQVLGLNGEPVVSMVTGAEGKAVFPSLAGFIRDKTPVAVAAVKGFDMSFIPLGRNDRYLDMSRFDVGGVQTHSLRDGLQAYLFSDRGIYRPGDEIRLGMIVKGTDWSRDLGGVPLEISVTDARGLEVHKERLRLSRSAFEEFKYSTQETSPTGAWRFSVYIVKDNRRHGLLDSISVRVEEFLPDRLRIETKISKERTQGWVAPKGLRGEVTLKNLYGTPARGHNVGARIRLIPAKPEFARYPGFFFSDPNRDARPFEERLQDKSTDDEGRVEFPLNLERFTGSVYSLQFYAQGFEASGGRSVAAESVVLVSDLAYLLGFDPGGRLDYVHRASTRAVQLLAVGPDLEPVDVAGLSLIIFERKHVSALKRQPDGTYKYESVIKEIQLSSKTVSVGHSGLEVPLETEKAGEYRLAVRAEGQGDELLEFVYTVVGDANVTRSLEKAAQLQVLLDRVDYAPGDWIELQIKSPYKGAGLITIEREGVYAQKWFKAPNTSTVERIRLPEGVEGNAYLGVSLTRAADSSEIYMKPLSYAVVPFTISRERRTIPIVLDIPEKGLPGEVYRMRYRTERPARIVVFAVDEGILQVAGYKTPNPLDKFLAKRALEVRTAQILDQIMPDYSSVPGLKAPGGGDAMALGKNLNPFKRRRNVPVAYWSGIVEAGPKWRELEYTIPDHFNGTLRVIAVAVSQDAIGVAEKRALIRGPFVITPQVPLFMAPGDRAWLTASVLNNLESDEKEARVSVRTRVSKHLRLLSAASMEVVIAKGREAMTRFEVQALDHLGASEITFEAAYGEQRSRAGIGVSVRPAVPYRTSVNSGRMKKGRQDTATPRRMYPHFRSLKAAASTLPLGLAHGLSNYLKSFPYACTEQLVSRSFGALALRRRPEFGYGASNVEASLAQSLQILRARQNAEGAFGFWAANSHVSPFQAIYAVHFLTEAEASGYPVDRELAQRAESYLDRILVRESGSLGDARESAYAAYILTRRGRVRTRSIDSLREKLEERDFDGWETDLTAAYLAGTYKLLHLDRKADKLMRSLELGAPQKTDYSRFYDGLRRDAQLLYLWAKHFPERIPKMSENALDPMLSAIESGGFNTVSAAYSILAFDAYADIVDSPALRDVRLAQKLEDGQRAPLPLPSGLFPEVEFSSAATTVFFENPGPYALFHQVTVSGFDKAPPTEKLKRKIEVHREYRNAEGREVTAAKVGDDIDVILRLRSLEGGAHYNVAIIDLLPGGFEPVRDPEDRMDGNVRVAITGSTWTPDYADLREDRLVLFGTIVEDVREFRYRIRAVNSGSYAVPPAYAESMYDRAVEARSLGGKMAVSDTAE